jgi:HSP20 family protein
MLVRRWPPLPANAFEADPAGTDVDWRPDMDVFELPEEFLVILSLPGVRVQDVDVTVFRKIMTIAGTRRPAIPPGAIAHLIESTRGRFERRIRLPAATDVAGIQTTLADGELQVRVRKAAPQTRRIAIASDRP